MGASSSTTYNTSEVNPADEMYRHYQKLLNELKESIERLNSEFDTNHQTLTGQINNLNNIAGELEKTKVGRLRESAERIAAVLGLGSTQVTLGVFFADIAESVVAEVLSAEYNIDTIIEHLRAISETKKKLQLYSVQDEEKEKIDKTLKLHKQLKGTIPNLVRALDNYSINVRNETKEAVITSKTLTLISLKSDDSDQKTLIRKTAAQFKKTLNEIKQTKDYFNTSI